MGRNSPNLGTNQTTSTSRKKCQQKQGRKQLLDLKLFNQQEAGDRIHQPKQVSHAVNNLTSFTLCLKQKENRGEQSNDREDEEDLMKNIQILLDSHPKCNFVQQILQRLCDEGKVWREFVG
uniref:Uncharacterized protein n=1 Tax=Setaria digitata TaxID=48799 RepID=A0A915Q0S2_9BILA